MFNLIFIASAAYLILWRNKTWIGAITSSGLELIPLLYGIEIFEKILECFTRLYQILMDAVNLGKSSTLRRGKWPQKYQLKP